MRRSLVLCLVLVVVPTAPLRADDGEPPSPLRELSVAEAAFEGVLSAGILAAVLLPLPVHEDPQWRGGVLFDDAARGALQLRSPTERELAAAFSDAVASGLVLFPVLVDALVLAWLVRGDPVLMGRMLLNNLSAHALAQGLTTLFKHVVGRERPMVRGCHEDAQRQQDDPACESRPDPDVAPVSFFSGHTSLAFTSAALVCLHHTELGLLGPEGGAAAATCATGMALASTVGLLRVLADRHYLTDVLVGAGVGILSGWLVPWLLHYDVADPVTRDGGSATVAPMVDGETFGVQLFGVF